MAEYNPSKIIKDGNTYNFRDDSKIPLAGSNKISGNLIPSTDGTVNLGSLSYQWDQAYIKSLTINGVVCGDILTHNASEFASKATTLSGYGITDAYTKTQVDKKVSDLVNSAPETLDTLNELASALGNDPNFATTVANQIGTKANDSEVVKLSGNQTIGGVKTFTAGGCTFWKQIKINHNLEYGTNNPPSTSAYHNLKFTDANGWWGGYLENVTDTSGNSTLALYVRNTNDIQSRVYLKSDINGSFSMYPLSNNVWDLGTSTNKWKTINGINPGALSLPGSYVNVDTTNWALDGSAVNVFTPTSDGWLGIQGVDSVYDQMHYIFIGRNDSASYHSQNMLSPINGLWSKSYHGCVFIPVVKNTRYDIRCICDKITATFFPCKGNV